MRCLSIKGASINGFLDVAKKPLSLNGIVFRHPLRTAKTMPLERLSYLVNGMYLIFSI